MKTAITLLIMIICVGFTYSWNLMAGTASVPKAQSAIDYAARAQEHLRILEGAVEKFKGQMSKREIVSACVENAYAQGIKNNDVHALDFAYIPDKDGIAAVAYFPVKIAHLRSNLEDMSYGPNVSMKIEYPEFHCEQSYNGLTGCKATFTLTGNSPERKFFTKSFYCEAQFAYSDGGSFSVESVISNDVLGMLNIVDGHGSKREEIPMDSLTCSVTGSVTKAKLTRLRCY